MVINVNLIKVIITTLIGVVVRVVNIVIKITVAVNILVDGMKQEKEAKYVQIILV